VTSGFIINVLRNWVREQRADPTQAFPGNGQQKPEDAAITQLKREVARLMRGAALFARPRRRQSQWIAARARST
jgi:transposase